MAVLQSLKALHNHEVIGYSSLLVLELHTNGVVKLKVRFQPGDELEERVIPGQYLIGPIMQLVMGPRIGDSHN